MGYEKVRFQNGVELSLEDVQRVYFGLETLEKTNPAALYELYKGCLTTDHRVIVNRGILTELGLVDHWTIDDSVQTVVMFCVHVEEFHIWVTPPVVEGPYEV